jgi:hypothetical protein
MLTQIKGLIRFSYPAEGGFKLNRQSEGNVADALFHPDRLRRRMELFRRFTLPSLIAQTDQDFKAAILIGEKMPIEFRKELEDMLAPHAFAKIVALPPMEHYKATQAALAAIPTQQDTSHIATFRLDDDDAIHIEMIQRIRNLAEGLLQMREDERPFVIGFMHGHFMSLEGDLAVVSRVTERTPLGVGLTMVAPVASPVNIFVQNNHRSIAEKFDTYTDASRPMFIRTVHDLNDSGAVNSGKMFAMETPEDWETFHRSFALDLDGVNLHTLFEY